MAEKQGHLNGAYYGPSVPPSQKHYHRPGRGSGCGCGCCLLSLLLKIITTVVVIVGLAVLIFWLIFRPVNKVKFHVTDVSLTQFNLSTNNNLDYKLSLNITVRNPNKKIGIYYDRIEARAYYDDQRLSSVFLTPFYQGHKTTNVLSPVFEGQQLLLGAERVAEFNEEKTGGLYSIDVKLYLRVRFKLGVVKTPRFKPTIKCDLNVPMNSNTRLAAGSHVTKCDFDF